MKKILFLLLVCLIKLNAWQLITRDFQSSTQTAFQYYYDNTSSQIKFMSFYNGNPNLSGNSPNDTYFWMGLSTVRQYNGTQQYKTIKYINNRFKEEPIILNDFYELGTQLILNYFYNPNNFNKANHIQYENYEILYEENGLAVESIVNGKWAGIYADSGQSGYLYNKKGDLLYVNGEPASFFEKINNKLLKRFKINLESIFIKNIFYPLLVLIFACVIFRSVIRMAFKAFLIRFYDKKIGQLEKRRENIENA